MVEIDAVVEFLHVGLKQMLEMLISVFLEKRVSHMWYSAGHERAVIQTTLPFTSNTIDMLSCQHDK